MGLIVVEHDDPRGRPTPGHRDVAEIGLNFGGLFIVDDLI